MLKPVNISWTKTKKNVEQIISQYIYYSLSVDNSSSSNIGDSYLLDALDFNSIDKTYVKISQEEQKRRIDFVNYVRFSFNKLTTEERKIIYWTYLDKENNYDDRFIANNLGFSLSNTFEAKVKDKESKKDETKKVMLLNNLNLATNYNLAADSLAWSPVRISGGTQLFNQKMDINFATTLDPYAIDNSGKRIEKFNIDNGGSLFRMTSANMTLNYSFSSTDGEKKKDKQNQQNGGTGDDLFGTSTDLSDSRQSLFKKDDDENLEKTTSNEWYATKLPWDLSLAYSVTYNNSNRESEISSNSLMASGNVELAPRWKVGFSSGYDFKQKGITFTQLRFERDLESWRMSFNWVPIGTNTYWGFFIGISSSILSDIKYDKRQIPDRVF